MKQNSKKIFDIILLDSKVFQLKETLGAISFQLHLLQFKNSRNEVEEEKKKELKK